jgi:hypothetical protein
MSLIDRIRAQAMSDEGISDTQMQEMQGEKLMRQHLEEVAQRDGGEAAIRAAMRPRGAKKPGTRANPASRGSDLAAEEALGERNIAGILAAEQAQRAQPAAAGPSWNRSAPRWSGPPGMAPSGAIGGAMRQAATPPGRHPLMSAPAAPPNIPPEVQQMLQQEAAPQGAPQIAPEEAQGLMQMIMSLFRGGGAPAQAAAPSGNPWTGPASMQGGALNNIQQGMGRR